MKLFRLLIPCIVVWLFLGYTGSVSDVAASEEADGQSMVSVYDFGAAGNGLFDDTEAVQKAVDSDMPVYFPPGTYMLSKTVLITGKKNWTMYAKDASFFYTGTDYAFRVLDGENCCIEVGQINAMDGGGIEFCFDEETARNQQVSFWGDYAECKKDGAHYEVPKQ